jgi:hypothetical protein
MNTSAFTCLAVLSLAAANCSFADESAARISGQYLEVRSCDVYTGPCVANGEMGLAGKEGILVWTVSEGSWHGTALDGLNVIAVLRTEDTMGDVHFEPRKGKAVLILDGKASAEQRSALASFARTMANGLIDDVVEVKTATIDADLGNCTKAGCATVRAGHLVEVSTRCFGGQDHLCGNESTFYPPLTVVHSARPAFTEMASFKGSGLGLTWESTGQRSAFLAAFSR